jgi:hypothetical protein
MKKIILLVSILTLLAIAQLSNAAYDPGQGGGAGTQIFVYINKNSAEIGDIISGKATLRVYKGKTAVFYVEYGDSIRDSMSSCSAVNTDKDYIECDYEFIHIYDKPGKYNLVAAAFVDAHSTIKASPEIIVISSSSDPVSTSTGAAIEATSTAAIIKKIAGVVYWVVGSLFVLIFMIGGFMFLTSSGNPNQITKAKEIITYAIIGITIMALARGIIEFIKLVLDIK